MQNDANRTARSVLLIRLLGTVVLFFTASGVLAQLSTCPELENHPDSIALEREFLNARIDVSVGITQAVHADYQTLPAYIEPSTWKHWSASQNSKPLSEVGLFTACGLEAEANRARRHYASADRRIAVGGVVSKLGVVAMIVGSFGLAAMPSDKNNWPLPTLIGGGCIAGLAFFLEYSGYRNRYRSCASYGEAKAAADDYNARLCRSLTANKTRTD